MILSKKYDLENLLDVNFPFKISNINKNNGLFYFKINDVQMCIRNYEVYNNFGYYLKRYFDLHSGNVSESFNLNEVNSHVYFNGDMTLYETLTTLNITIEEKYLYERFQSYSPKCFWGTIIDEKYVNIGQRKPIKTEYSPHSKDKMTTKVLVQPEGVSYGESYFVYIDKKFRPSHETKILHKFIKDNGILHYVKSFFNNWVY